MILSSKKVLELCEQMKLLENLDARESYPEGVGIDIRVGEVYVLQGEGFLGKTERKSPDINLIASIAKGDKEVVIKPHDYVLVKTIEKINLPGNKVSIDGGEPYYLMADVHPRSTLQRCGLYLMATKTDPGYTGELTFAITNLSNVPFRLELGARIANIVFHQVVGEIARAYEGQWKGGRVATGGKETQI